MIYKDFCFIHIPKTAGTTLRGVMEKKFTSSHDVLFDYGAGNEATSKSIKDFFYTNKVIDRTSFDNLIRKEKPIILFGHFLATKYLNLLKDPNVHTFLRDPFERFLSEFIHHRERYGSKADFADFLTNEVHCNAINKYLDGLKMDQFSSIGDMKNFTNGLAIMLNAEGKNFNFLDKIKYRVIKRNTSPVKDKIAYVLKVSPEFGDEKNIRRLFEKSNQKDLAIYKKYMESRFL